MTDLSLKNFLSLSAVLVLLPSVSLGEETKITAAGFSRAEWIEQRLERTLFSGGVLPTTNRLPVPAIPGKSSRAGAARSGRLRRVNDDLLVGEAVPQPGTQAEPYIHANPFDPRHLIAGWQENRFPDGGAQSLNVAVSFDGGKSWTESLLPGLTAVSGGPWERASDPWVEFGPDNHVFFASLLFNQTTPDNAIGVSRSTDGGLSWGEPVIVFRSTADFNDKEALTIDTFPESRFFGRVYVAWDLNLDTSPVQELLVARSTDRGLSYRRPRLVRSSNVNIGAAPRVGPDGTVYLVWSGNSLGRSALQILFSRSRNGGRRWSEPKVIAELLSLGVASLRTGEILPSFAVDPVSGDLHVGWQDARWTGVDQATLISSRDGGATWSEPARVSAAPDDAATFTVSVAVDRRGTVGVSYYSLENDPVRAFLVDRYLRVSGDGGESFGAPIRVTRETFDVRFAAQARGYFLGDYVGLTGKKRGFHLLWISTRRISAALGLQQPDAWAARAR
ncbi:MAG: glycoside hydrolase [Acidobacteriota bacterium]|nr:glycoside hydrolase [Acidobacteriota bacterium]